MVSRRLDHEAYAMLTFATNKFSVEMASVAPDAKAAYEDVRADATATNW